MSSFFSNNRRKTWIVGTEIKDSHLKIIMVLKDSFSGFIITFWPVVITTNEIGIKSTPVIMISLLVRKSSGKAKQVKDSATYITVENFIVLWVIIFRFTEFEFVFGVAAEA